MKRRTILSALVAASIAPSFIREARGQIALPQSSYVPIPVSAYPDLVINDGFRTTRETDTGTSHGFIIQFAYSASDPKLSGKSFFLPGENINTLSTGEQLWTTGSTNTSEQINGRHRNTNLGVSIAEDDGSASRLSGNPYANNMSLACPSEGQTRVESLTDREKTQILQAITESRIQLRQIPDDWARPSGYHLPDGSRLIILHNQNNSTDLQRTQIRIFQTQSGGRTVERGGVYDNQTGGYNIEGIGLLVAPSSFDHMVDGRHYNVLPAELNGAPIRPLNRTELLEILQGNDFKRQIGRSSFITPCSGPQRDGMS